MCAQLSSPINTGLDVVNLLGNAAFSARAPKHRSMALQMEGLRRLTRAFVEAPATLLQELVNSALDLCGAESAGISIVRDKNQSLTSCGDPISDRQLSDESYYEWIATAGRYAHLLHATLPRYPSACGICMERNQPQLFRITPPFFAILGMPPDTITDGILLPWRAGSSVGTFWIMSHHLDEAFDLGDLSILQILVDFAAMAIRQQQQQQVDMQAARTIGARAMANNLAHELNNPLQSVTNLVYLASLEKVSPGTEALADSLDGPLRRLSHLVATLLVTPLFGATTATPVTPDRR